MVNLDHMKVNSKSKAEKIPLSYSLTKEGKIEKVFRKAEEKRKGREMM